MRISPLNLLFAFFMGYLAFSLLQAKETRHLRAAEMISELRLWHALLAVFIILVDIVFRALLPDTKRLWLFESVFIILVAGMFQLLKFIIPASLF